MSAQELFDDCAKKQDALAACALHLVNRIAKEGLTDDIKVKVDRVSSNSKVNGEMMVGAVMRAVDNGESLKLERP